MTWNLSRSYALSVGLLANKLIGAEGITFERQSKKKQNQFSIAEMKALQQQLNQLGFVSGEPDGIWGPKSRKAIKQFQLKENLIADGYPNEDVFLALQKKQKITTQ
jgi:membrane-bound lytic murein transglycosylase B